MTTKTIWEDFEELPVVRTEFKSYPESATDTLYEEVYGSIHLSHPLGEWDVAMSIAEAAALSAKIDAVISNVMVRKEVEA